MEKIGMHGLVISKDQLFHVIHSRIYLLVVVVEMPLVDDQWHQLRATTVPAFRVLTDRRF